jgi:hypothetical protein
MLYLLRREGAHSDDDDDDDDLFLITDTEKIHQNMFRMWGYMRIASKSI